MKNVIHFGTGRIGEIISGIKEHHKIDSVYSLPVKVKLDYLCQALQVSYKQFDKIIAENSPVFRTVKAHVFETIFDKIVLAAGHECKEIGGDAEVDRIVNGHTLQLKTPYLAGCNEHIISYKTHKTHGAKSELESMDYYHSKSHFADYLVGLISYDPLRIIFIPRDDLPCHPQDPERIISPFAVEYNDNPNVNAFHYIGVESINEDSSEFSPQKGNELLPASAEVCEATTEIIVDTILNEANFRIWDMSIRGFARQIIFNDYLLEKKIEPINPVSVKESRGDKADLAIYSLKEKKYIFFQIKGVSTNNCKFNGEDSIVATETQLTRGRVNDHPTQSRLYLKTDFDFLLLILDPCQVHLYRTETGMEPALEWEYYSIPVDDLEPHKKMPHRLKTLQAFRYTDLQEYIVEPSWSDQWK